MFSQVPVILFRCGWVSLVPCRFWGSGITDPRPLPRGGYAWCQVPSSEGGRLMGVSQEGGWEYLGYTPTPCTDTQWWTPKHIRLASGRYASYWNAFL